MELCASPTAYAKALLHSLQHPPQPVTGLLLGRVHAEGSLLFVTDVLPTLHSSPCVCPHPVMDAALAMGEAIARQRGLGIVGLYTATERVADSTLVEGVRRYGTRMVQRLTAGVEVGSGAAGPASQIPIVLWRIRNDVLREKALASELSVEPFWPDGSTEGWSAKGRVASGSHARRMGFATWNLETCAVQQLPQATALRHVARGVEEAAFSVVDVEDHLGNLQLDFLNPSFSMDVAP